MIYFQRIFFVVSCVFFSFFMWNFWHTHFFVHQDTQKIHNDLNSTHHETNHHSERDQQLINIQNDVISLDINLLGGNIEHADLLKYHKNVNQDTPFSFLKNEGRCVHRVVSGIVENQNIDYFSMTKKPLYTTSAKLYKLKTFNNTVKACMKWQSKDNIRYTKIFSLQRGSYNVHVEYLIQNNSKKPIYRSVFHEIQHTIPSVKKKSFLDNLFDFKRFTGIAFSTDQEKYHKYTFNEINHKKKIIAVTKTGWIAVLHRHFLTAWIPQFSDQYKIYTNQLNAYTKSIGYISNVKYIQPNSFYKIGSQVWIGPKIQSKLSHISYYLSLTTDYGWLRFIAYPLFKLLTIFYSLFHNWGIAIILCTLLIKVFTYPLTKLQYISVLQMKILYPKIKEIKNQFASDPGRINKEILSLYQSKNINPLNGFFSFIIQTPIFLAFYRVLIASVELRHAPFCFWMKDLSSYDPYYILPIFIGFSMLLIQFNEINNNDRFIQKFFSYIFPFFSIIFFVRLPSGLALYYVINNFFTFFQHWFIRWNLLKYNT